MACIEGSATPVIAKAIPSDETVIHHRVATHFDSKLDQGQGFTAALCMPEHTGFNLAIFSSTQAFNDLVHGSILPVTGNLLDDFATVHLEDHKVLHQVEKAVDGKHTGEQVLLPVVALQLL